MTSFLAGSGFGGQAPKSRESKALERIDSRTQPFVNKDFVKNMAWLNSSVDTLSAYTQKLQQGVDKANENAIEQIQGFIADILVLFGGLEPTGFDFGDLKYVLQGIGALLGINPDTPFPLNLLEAAWHMFTNYIVPLPQYTDLIFSAIEAWAEELGLSDEAVDAIDEFNTTVTLWYQHVEDSFGVLGDIFEGILSVFGLGSGTSSTSPIFDPWAEIQNFIEDLIAGPQDLLLNIISQIVVALFKSLTWVVKALDPMLWINSSGLSGVGPQLVPGESNQTTVWNVGVDPNTSWVYNSGLGGYFTTNANSTNKRLLTQALQSCSPGQQYNLDGEMWWQSLNVGVNTFGPIVVWYLNGAEVGQTSVNAIGGHGTNGGWIHFSDTVTVPLNVNGFRIGARVTSTLTSGTVRVRNLSFTQELGGAAGLVDGVVSFIDGVLKLDFFDGVIDGELNKNVVTDWFNSLFGIHDPIPAYNLYGTAPTSVFDQIPLAAVAEQPATNYLANPHFTPGFLGEGSEWQEDPTETHSDLTEEPDAGSAMVAANGSPHDLYSNAMTVSVGQKIPMTIWTKWTGLTATGTPIALKARGSDAAGEIETEVLDFISAGASSAGWTELTGTYTVPAGVTEVRMIEYVDPSATAGTVKFSHGFMGKQFIAGVAPIDWTFGLQGWLDDLNEFGHDIIDGVLNGINGIGTWIGATITDLINEVSSWFDTTESTAAQASDTQFDLNDTWNRFLRIFLGDPVATGGTADDVETFIVSQQDAIVTAQNSAITLANLANAPKNVPFWVSPNPFEDVSFPRALIEEGIPDNPSATGSTDPPNTGGHQHSIANPTVVNGTPTVTVAAGTLCLSTIRTTANRIYNSVGFLTDGAVPPSTVYAGLYKIDPANGTMTLEYNFGNISGEILTGTVTSGVAFDTRFNTVLDIIASEGDLWALGILPIGGSLNIVAIRKTTLTITGVYPRFATSILASQSSLPSTVTDGSQSDATRRGWACIGQAIPEDTSLVTMVETFNSPDNGAFATPNWNIFNHFAGASSSQVGVASQAAYENTGFSSSFGWMSSRLAKTLLHTNSQASKITMGPGYWDSSAYGNSTCRAYLRCRSTGSLGVVMHVDSAGGVDTNARVRIATITDMNSIGTVRATSSGSLTAAQGDDFEIQAVGTVYTCYRNGIAVPGATWTDSGGVIPVTKNFRTAGFGTGSYRDGLAGIHPCRYIDQWTAYDLAA